jgi:excinuclease UvrABC nuclease subunit
MIININFPENYYDIPKDKLRENTHRPNGVYVFYDHNDIPLYVGKTVNFRRRMIEHAKSSPFYHMTGYVRLYEMNNEYEKDVLESYLINDLKPQYNKAKTFYKQSDYDDMLYEIDEQIEELIDRLSDLDETLNPFDYVAAYGDEFDFGEEYDEYEDQYEVLDKACAQKEIDEINYEISKLRKRKQSIVLRKSN